MKIFFKTRKAVRNFPKSVNTKIVDCGINSPKNRRWAIQATT